MRRSSGFSLMEMMIVLLIVAIVAAASAPMVSRKLASESGLASTAHCLWQENGKGSITFNADMKGVPLSEQGRKSVIIGTSTVTDENGDKIDANSKEKPRLFIKSNSIKNSHIELSGGGNDNSINSSKISFFDGNTWFSSEEMGNNAMDTVAIGVKAKATGTASIAIGRNVVAEDNSIAIGPSYYDGDPVWAKPNSIAVGYQSEPNENSIAIGSHSNTTGTNAIAIGGDVASASNNSVALGYGASAQGTDTIAIGNGARTIPNITNSIALGSGAVIAANNSMAIGCGAGSSNLYSLAIGEGAHSRAVDAIVIGRGADSDNAEEGIAIGRGAHSGETGSIAIGADAVGSNVSSNSVLLGTKLTSGANSTIQIGRDSTVYANANNSIAIGKDITIGDGSKDSIVIGRGSSIANGTYQTIVIGTSSEAAANTTPSSSVAIGYEADVVHDNSVALGFGAKGGEFNSTAIGCGTKANHKNSTAIGYNARTTASNQIVLGNADTTVYIPGNLVVDGYTFLGRKSASRTYVRTIKRTGDTGRDNVISMLTTADIGRNENTVAIYSKIMNKIGDKDYTGWNPSDRRLKNVGEVFKGGLDEIKKLEVFNYTYKKDKDKTPRVGVMAQDLQKIFPNAVFKGDDGFLRIRMEDMFYALVNAVKELDKRIDLLVEKQKKIDELEKRVDTLEKRLAKLEKQMKEK